MVGHVRITRLVPLKMCEQQLPPNVSRLDAKLNGNEVLTKAIPNSYTLPRRYLVLIQKPPLQVAQVNVPDFCTFGIRHAVTWYPDGRLTLPLQYQLTM